MKRIFTIVAAMILGWATGRSQQGVETILKRLNATIDSTSYYDQAKYRNIAALLNEGPGKDAAPNAQFAHQLRLYEAYRVFKFDTAFIYAKKLEEIAHAINDPVKIAQAKIKVAFVLLSAGMYGESNDLMKEVSVATLPDSLKAEYYLTRGRYYYDLADYDNDDYFYPVYFRQAGQYLDSALAIYDPQSFEFIYYSGLKQMKTGEMNKAFANFRALTNRAGLTDHQLAITASTQSFIYASRGFKDTAIMYQVMAAMADIRSSTKETFATLSLAQMLFAEGDFQRAAAYIRKAVADASAYGARQRKVQLSTITPIIQSSEINYLDQQRKAWILYGAAVSVIVILFALLLVTIFRQNKRVRKAKEDIQAAHTQLSEVNHKLENLNKELVNANHRLQEVNTHLEEANKIKEEYVGYFFTVNAELFRKIEKFKTTINEKLHYGKANEIKFILNNIDARSEEQELLKTFDRAFLKLFPHFVTDFNALFETENQVKLQDGELLNTELRIYALLRLGIRENEKIAEILQYSVKSIYAYKTKVRNRAKVPREDFDRMVMGIRSV